MELRHLVYFEAVARHQHVSRAAAELAVAQPAITKQLHDLERELGGGPLFKRVGRGLRLTDAGKAFQGHVQIILAQVEQAREEMRQQGTLQRGRVAIGAPQTVGERLLPDILASFHRLHPNLDLRMVEGSTRPLLEQLDSGGLDVAVVTMPVVRRDLWVTRLFSEELVVVVARNHPLATRAAVTFSDLADEPFLLYSPGGYVRDATLEACRQAGYQPRVVLDGGTLAMLLRLAEAGLGIAVLPPLALSGNEPLAALPISDVQLSRTVALVSRGASTLLPATLALREFLAQQLAREK